MTDEAMTDMTSNFDITHAQSIPGQTDMKTPEQQRHLPTQLHAVRDRLASDEDGERGAVLMILALLITVLLLCAGFAVDFGSWYNRAEQLQNAADAGALAGAAEYDLYKGAGGTPTEEARGKAEARVLDVLAQNGITNGGDIEVRLTFPGELGNELGEVTVSVFDRDVDLYFSTFVIDRFELERSATAQVDKCGNECTNTVQIPKPFSELNVTGRGDGFKPIFLGDRMYAINHHDFDADIVCVTINTVPQDLCANYPQPVMPVTGTEDRYTGNGSNQWKYPEGSWDPMLSEMAVQTEVVGTRIYLVGQTKNKVKLVCWETDLYDDGNPLTDPIGGPCPGSQGNVDIATRNGLSYKNWWNNEGDAPREHRGGSLTFVRDANSEEGRLFVFTDDHQIHCRLSTDTTQSCSGYPKGTGLGQDAPVMTGANGTDRTQDGGTWGLSDRIYDPETQRIYSITHFPPTNPNLDHLGARLQCWDAQNNRICTGFPNSVALHSDGDPDFNGAKWGEWQVGRLFFDRTTTGKPKGICSMGHEGTSNIAANHRDIDTDCVDMAGQNPYEITGFDDAFPGGTLFMGFHYYHPQSNRLIVNMGYIHRRANFTEPTHCWDFGALDEASPTTGYCGAMSDGTSWTDDYGYSSRGSCIFALGHNKKFYTFNSDMEKRCDEGQATTKVFPCVCYNDDQHWGSVVIEGELDPINGPYDFFKVLVKENEFDTEANALMVVDLLDTGGVVDLDTISADYPLLWLEIIVNVKTGRDPWNDFGGNNAPTVTVGFSDKPFLVE